MGKAVVGEILSFGNPGDRVWVKLGSRCFQATAATEINSGIATITVDEQGQAWVWCSTHPQVTRTRTTEFLKIVPETATPSQPENIKILFYLRTTQGYDWYIGGDRPNPIKIHSAARYPSNIYLSSLGRRLNDWVVGIRSVDSQNSYFVTNIFPNEEYTCTEPWAFYLNWTGDGFWQVYSSGGTNTPLTTLSTSSTGDAGNSTQTNIGSTSTFSFLKTSNSIVNDSGYRYDQVITTTRSTGTYIQTILITSDSNFSAFVFPEISTSGYKRYISEQRIQTNSHAGNEDYLGSYNTEDSDDIGIAPQIVDSVNQYYFYTKLHAQKRAAHYETVPSTEPTTVLTETRSAHFHFRDTSLELDNTHRINPNTGQEIPTPLDSINTKYSATLRKNKFFLVPPPANSNGIYRQGVWESKIKSDYSERNIYDNPDKTAGLTSVPVWIAAIDDRGVEIRKDAIVKRVYPLLENAVVVAASYSP